MGKRKTDNTSTQKKLIKDTNPIVLKCNNKKINIDAAT